MKEKKLSPLKAIRAHCLACSGFQPKEVRNCSITNCPLHLYRLGTNPARKGVGKGKVVFASKNVVETPKTEQNALLNEVSHA